MSKYKPMEVFFDLESFNRDNQRYEKTKELYQKAIDFCKKHSVDVTDHEKFYDSFTDYFTEEFHKQNSIELGKTKREISPQMLLNLFELSLTELIDIEKEIKKINYPLNLKEAGITQSNMFYLDSTKYKVFTKSSRENEMVRAGRNLIEAIQKVAEYTTVYPNQIQLGTGHFVQYDLRNNEYKMNPSLFGRRIRRDI